MTFHITYFSGEASSRGRRGTAGGGTGIGGGGSGDEDLSTSVPLSEILFERGRYVCVFAAGCE